MAELGKAGNNKLPNLLILLVTANQEHVSNNSILQHSFAWDSIVAKGQENPTNVGLDHVIVKSSKAVEQIHYPIADQDVDAFVTECEVHQSQSAELLHIYVRVLVFAYFHYDIETTSIDQVIEKLIMIG